MVIDKSFCCVEPLGRAASRFGAPQPVLDLEGARRRGMCAAAGVVFVAQSPEATQ